MNPSSENRFDLLELDIDRPAPKAEAAPEPDSFIELDLVDRGAAKCFICSKAADLDDSGRCETCWTKAHIDAEEEAPVTPEVGADFAGIATEAAANAAGLNLGDLAVGRATLGVGFTSAAGYIEALRRGVKKATKTEYVSLLKTRYNVDFTEITPILDGENVLPVGEGVTILPSGVGPTFEEQIAEARRVKAKAAAEAKAKEGASSPDGIVIVPEAEENENVRLTHGALVAGAVAEGHGVLTGWSGRRPLTHAKLVELREAAGCPIEWDPDPKESKTQARRAVQKFATKDLLLVPEKKASKAGVVSASLIPHDGRWILVASAGASVAAGEKYGEVKLVVTLRGASLETDGDQDLADAVREEYDRLVGEAVHQAPDVTAWLTWVLTSKFEAVRYGGNWYVSKKHREAAEKLCDTFSAAWGEDWLVPALPVATSNQLARGLANGLQKEVDTVLEELANAREIAKKSAKTGDIGPKAAATFLLKLKKIGERVVSYGNLIGSSLVDECRIKVRDGVGALNGLASMDGISERFAAVWDEIEFDIKVKDGVL